VIPRSLAKYVADLVTFPGDAALAYRNEGLRGVWAAITPRTIHRLVRISRLTIFAQPLGVIPDIRMPAGVTIAPLRPQQIPLLAPIAGERDRERFRRLMEIGCTGLVAWRGDRPVGYTWVATEMRPEVSHCPLVLPAEAAYLAASLRTLHRSGASTRIVGQLRYLKLGSRLFSRFTPCPPAPH
jgi:hypothetical protein